MNSQNNVKVFENGYTYGFTSYGVKIGLIGSTPEILNEMKDVVNYLPFNPIEMNFEKTEFDFYINYKKGKYVLLKNGKKISFTDDKIHTFNWLLKEIKTTVAEYAVSKVFLHAGAVSIDNKGIVFPGKSYYGKSTLTAELVKAGAVYYSDDLAVLDEDAKLHPFPKLLSLRGIHSQFEQTDLPIEHFGGQVGVKPVQIKLIVLTEYEKDFVWSPETLSPGSAIMDILPHTIPTRFNPKFTLEVLHKLVNRAIITKSKRGEAKYFANILLKYLEEVDF